MNDCRPNTPLAFALALLFALTSGCAHRGAPSIYPELDAATARPGLVAVELVATDFLPPFPQCASKDVLCMDPPPTWIKFRTLQTVYGEPMPKTFFASTTSHYGRIDAHGLTDHPQLVLLLTHEGSSVMPRYSRATLHADSAGERHLVLLDDGPHWLPCTISTLREPLTDPTLLRLSAVSREHYDRYYAENAAEHFRLEGGFAYPRFSVPMSRLRAHLADRQLAAADFRCERTGD